MKRHDALRPFSRGHQPLLVHARDLRWRAAYLTRGDSHLGRAAWPAFRSWARSALEAHLAAEECHLLPRLAAVGGDAVAAALAQDADARAELRRVLKSLVDADEESPAVLRRVARALRGHVLGCERTLFPLAERVLTEADLSEVLRDVAAYEV